MKTSNIITGVLAVALSLGGVAAQAHDRGGDRKDREAPRQILMFDEMDTNGDGEITLDEIEAQGAARFATADTDGDGLLSADELAAQAQARKAERMAAREAEMTERMIERRDANDDGMLSPEEMQGRRDPADMFKRVDANGDGVVTAVEFADATKRMHHKMERRDHDKGQRHHNDH
ncbi:EF-hand domain-containing protein [Puniceibacterium sp. IMCC21224]|uniref:EF-hand domain-containing protein n=1 Tax=Puniceibacterium sp. IMCC21224 TaxID=1618204 RepID=UPI00064DBC98|nr:EF-hand domain-containing protein [Puniceibacterium sp. IMCC21224]KMK68104.1 hypothetical protein IMCC21224_112984 [Puniceibacterium sp. IMCC21224]